VTPTLVTSLTATSRWNCTQTGGQLNVGLCRFVSSVARINYKPRRHTHKARSIAFRRCNWPHQWRQMRLYLEAKQLILITSRSFKRAASRPVAKLPNCVTSAYWRVYAVGQSQVDLAANTVAVMHYSHPREILINSRFTGKPLQLFATDF